MPVSRFLDQYAGSRLLLEIGEEMKERKYGGLCSQCVEKFRKKIDRVQGEGGHNNTCTNCGKLCIPLVVIFKEDET